MIDVETGGLVEFANDRMDALQAEIATAMGDKIVHHWFELYVGKRPARPRLKRSERGTRLQGWLIDNQRAVWSMQCVIGPPLMPKA